MFANFPWVGSWHYDYVGYFICRKDNDSRGRLIQEMQFYLNIKVDRRKKYLGAR